MAKTKQKDQTYQTPSIYSAKTTREFDNLLMRSYLGEDNYRKQMGLKKNEFTEPGKGLAVVRYETRSAYNPKGGGSVNRTIPIYGKFGAEDLKIKQPENNSTSTNSSTSDYSPTELIATPGTFDSSTSESQKSVGTPMMGIGTAVDGNAAGFKRKKSSARSAGRTTMGSSQLRIGLQTAGGSGLNIGK